jgi:hypothetical protein
MLPELDPEETLLLVTEPEPEYDERLDCELEGL